MYASPKHSIVKLEDSLANYEKYEEKIKKWGYIYVVSGEKVFAYSVINANDLVNKDRRPKMTLTEAMIYVLKSLEDNQAHVDFLRNRIFHDLLYYRKDGSYAPSNQIATNARNNPNIFTVYKGNVIELKEEYEKYLK
jgi:hypothetical protein